MTKEKKVNLFADIISPGVVVLLTVILFLVFIPDAPGKLFWTNLVFVAFLEVVFFAYVAWLPKCDSSVALKWISGVFTMYYIAASLIWLTLYSLLICHFWSIKFYYAGFAVLTVLWILVGALSVKVETRHELSVDAMVANRHTANQINYAADMLLSQFTLKATAHPELAAAKGPVTSLCRGLATLSPAAVDNPSVAQQAYEICSGLERLLESQPPDDSYLKIKEYAEAALIKLNFLKKSAIN